MIYKSAYIQTLSVCRYAHCIDIPMKVSGCLSGILTYHFLINRRSHARLFSENSREGSVGLEPDTLSDGIDRVASVSFVICKSQTRKSDSVFVDEAVEILPVIPVDYLRYISGVRSHQITQSVGRNAP